MYLVKASTDTSTLEQDADTLSEAREFAKILKRVKGAYRVVISDRRGSRPVNVQSWTNTDGKWEST